MFNGLEYNHYQFRIWDKDHDAKECYKKNQNPNCSKNKLQAVEAEHDFNVLRSNHIVITEVKNLLLTMTTREELLKKTQCILLFGQRKSSLKWA